MNVYSVRVLYFAGLEDLTQRREERLDVPATVTNVDQLVAVLRARHQNLSLEGVRFAVNEEFVDPLHPIQAGDVVALIPPVSGG